MKFSKEDHQLLALWAADCAERVLPSFEVRHPKDVRPREAIEAGRAWACGGLTCGEARQAALVAHAAARDADGPAARAAARAAGHAAATAHVAGHARHAAGYAAKAVRYSAGTTDAEVAADERAWQVRRLPTHLRSTG